MNFKLNAFIIFVLCVSSLRAESSEENDSMELHERIVKHWTSGVDIVKSKLKEKCKENLGDEKAEEALKETKEAAKTAKDCMKGLIDFHGMHEELEKAKQSGEVNAVVNKYCGKRAAAKECLKPLAEQVKKCLNEEQTKRASNFRKMAHSVVDFMCDKDGEQATLFITKNGSQCMKSQKDNIKKCYKDTFPEGTFLVPHHDTLSKETCENVDKFQNCVVDHMKSCDDATPANVMNSMMTSVKANFPCNEA